MLPFETFSFQFFLLFCYVHMISELDLFSRWAGKGQGESVVRIEVTAEVKLISDEAIQ